MQSTLTTVTFTCNKSKSNHLTVTVVMGYNSGAKKLVSDSLGLVDFVVGLVDSIFHLTDGQVKFFGGKFERKFK